jgi:hypothetical protein
MANELKSFKTYEQFINESLVFLTLKNTMKNEFMNDIVLKADYENARRNFYMNGGCLFTHIGGDEFELRSHISIHTEDLDGIIDSRINSSTERMKFRRVTKPKLDKIKDYIWTIKAELK